MKAYRNVAILVMSMFVIAACGTLTEDGTGVLFKTADPRLSIGVRLLPAPPLPESTPAVLPEATATALPTATPECVNAKANIGANGTRIYHLPGQSNYNTVKIDKEGEAIYCHEQEAIDAGFRKAQN